MLVLKGCPRCHGDLMLEVAPDADYYECLQCGHVLSFAQEQWLGVPTTHEHQPPVRRRRVPPRSIGPRGDAQPPAPSAPSPQAQALRRAFRPAYLP
jgi:hypothetical protein